MDAKLEHVAMRQTGDIAGLELLDETIDDHAATALLKELVEIVDLHRPKRVAVDFDRVKSATSQLIHSMIILRRALRDIGGQLELVNVNPTLREQFRRLNLSGTLFEIP